MTTTTMPLGLSDPSLIVHYGASANVFPALEKPADPKQVTKERKVFLYTSRCGFMFFSHAPIRPKIVEALRLSFLKEATSYSKIKRRTLNFYLGPISDFPLAARTTREHLPSFSFKEFNLCPSNVDGVFIWSRSDMRAFTVQNEGGFEYVRKHHQHENLRDYFQLDTLLSVKVENKPRLSIVK